MEVELKQQSIKLMFIRIRSYLQDAYKDRIRGNVVPMQKIL